ncbi:MAG: hypothetical protein NTV06_04870 [candidate division Zixibacteria bacterium]|nr:hypothetical protein [candidate division Zixibacteria bacterium]
MAAGPRGHVPEKQEGGALRSYQTVIPRRGEESSPPAGRAGTGRVEQGRAGRMLLPTNKWLLVLKEYGFVEQL